MMRIRIVRVGMAQIGVDVCVDVRLAWRVIRAVRMLMVRVVNMRMNMLHRLMDMLVSVAFGEVQPHPDRHQNSRRAEA